MNRDYDEDLFESSKMTFGEHLEELRAALFKSLIALLVGFGVGLAYGGHELVEWSQRPLKAALESHYRDLTTKRFEQIIAERRDAGESVPEETDAIQDLVMEDGLLFVETYVDPREIVRELKKSYPDEFADVDPSFYPPESVYNTDACSAALYNQVDSAKAKQYLADSNYQGEKVIIQTIGTSQSHVRTGLAIAEQLQSIGINAEMVKYDVQTWVAKP